MRYPAFLAEVTLWFFSQRLLPHQHDMFTYFKCYCCRSHNVQTCRYGFCVQQKFLPVKLSKSRPRLRHLVTLLHFDIQIALFVPQQLNSFVARRVVTTFQLLDIQYILLQVDFPRCPTSFPTTENFVVLYSVDIRLLYKVDRFSSP